jgi:LemA protein
LRVATAAAPSGAATPRDECARTSRSMTRTLQEGGSPVKKGMIGCVGVLALLVVLGLIVGAWATSQYNGLVRDQEGVKTAWSQVENVYQRRLDLIPNLVATVKGVAEFEKETYTAVTEARARVGQMNITSEVLDDPQAFQKLEAAQGELSSALSRLLVVAENYPQLKANQNFLDLQTQLEGTENRVAVERRRFNEVAQQYNTRLRVFPTNFIAGMFGFKERPYFEAAPGAEAAPKVEF